MLSVFGAKIVVACVAGGIVSVREKKLLQASGEAARRMRRGAPPPKLYFAFTIPPATQAKIVVKWPIVPLPIINTSHLTAPWSSRGGKVASNRDGIDDSLIDLHLHEVNCL